MDSGQISSTSHEFWAPQKVAFWFPETGARKFQGNPGKGDSYYFNLPDICIQNITYISYISVKIPAARAVRPNTDLPTHAFNFGGLVTYDKMFYCLWEARRWVSDGDLLPPPGGRRSPSETHRRAAPSARQVWIDTAAPANSPKKCHPTQPFHTSCSLSASTNSQVNEFGSYTWVGDRPRWPESAAFLYSTWASKMASMPGCRSKLDAAKASMERLESLRFFPAPPMRRRVVFRLPSTPSAALSPAGTLKSRADSAANLPRPALPVELRCNILVVRESKADFESFAVGVKTPPTMRHSF